MVEMSDRVENIIKAEARRLVWWQLGCQVIVQAVAYGSMLLLAFQIQQTVEDVLEQVRSFPQEQLDNLEDRARDFIPGVGR